MRDRCDAWLFDVGDVLFAANRRGVAELEVESYGVRSALSLSCNLKDLPASKAMKKR